MRARAGASRRRSRGSPSLRPDPDPACLRRPRRARGSRAVVVQLARRSGSRIRVGGGADRRSRPRMGPLAGPTRGRVADGLRAVRPQHPPAAGGEAGRRACARAGGWSPGDRGVHVWREPDVETSIFGQERANEVLMHDGATRSWYVDRLPGVELEAGWLFRLLPPGLQLRLSWHATPLPTAWIVDYLQRQLVGMRAIRLQHDSAASHPALA